MVRERAYGAAPAYPSIALAVLMLRIVDSQLTIVGQKQEIDQDDHVSGLLRHDVDVRLDSQRLCMYICV